MKAAVRAPDAGLVHAGGGVHYRLAGGADQEALQELLSDNSMEAWIRLSLERRPDYFAGERLMGESRTVLAREAASARTVGMYSVRHMPLHLDGKPAWANYLGELRVDSAYRHRLGILKHGFTSTRLLMPSRWHEDRWFTSIASDNARARRLLEANLPGMPRYTPLGEMQTLVFSTARGRPAAAWRAATHRDIPALADCYNRHAARWQLAPVLSEGWLAGLDGRNGLELRDFTLLYDGSTLQACIAVWDQRRYKQIVVRGYRAPLGLLRRPYNHWAQLTRQPQLPAPGEPLDAVFLAFATIESHDETQALAGVRHALAIAAARGARLGVFGLAVANPLAAFLRRRLKGRAYRSCIESVDFSGAVPAQLDGRPPQPEVALL